MRTSLPTIALLALVTPSFGNVLMCYYGRWASTRTGNGKFMPEDIDPTLCTHIMYTFLGINAQGDVVILNPQFDLPSGSNGFGRILALKKISPTTKIMISIGGGNEGSANFSTVSTSASLRATFVKNVLAFLKQYGFDGLDVDWEFPAQLGGASTDKANFVLLLKELKEAFRDEGYLLTAAVSAIEWSARQSYDIPRISEYLDYINVMAYDLHGTWGESIGINAPLYPASYEVTPSELQKNVEACINFWLNSGADPSKIVLGIPIYARTFTLADAHKNTPGSNFTGAGSAGPYTHEAGVLVYNELCEKQQDGTWTTVWFEEQQVPYSYSGNQWAGYDNAKSVRMKTKFTIKKGLAGVLFWTIDMDDFKPVCSDVKFPLISAAHDVLFPDSSVTSTPQIVTTKGEC